MGDKPAARERVGGGIEEINGKGRGETPVFSFDGKSDGKVFRLDGKSVDRFPFA